MKLTEIKCPGCLQHPGKSILNGVVTDMPCSWCSGRKVLLRREAPPEIMMVIDWARGLADEIDFADPSGYDPMIWIQMVIQLAERRLESFNEVIRLRGEVNDLKEQLSTLRYNQRIEHGDSSKFSDNAK